MTIFQMKTHLSSLRPKQFRKTAISSLPLFCWIVGRVFGHQRISLLEASPDYLRTRISADMVSARQPFLLAPPHPPLAHHSLFSQTPAPLLCLCPTASIPPTHPYKPSTRNEAPSSLHPKYGHYLQYSSTSRMSSIKFCFGWMFKYFWSGHVSPSL